MHGSRNFRQGVGVQVSLTKKALTFFFFFFFFFFCSFLVLILFYRSQMVNFKEIYHFSRFQRGSNIFQGGGGSNFFQGWSNSLFPIETHITCDFPGTPYPPLWIRYMYHDTSWALFFYTYILTMTGHDKQMP